MRKNFQSVKCTVLLTAPEYTSMLEAVDAKLREHKKNQAGPLIRICKESHDVNAVLRGRWHLHEFMISHGLPTATVSVDGQLSEFDLFLEGRVDPPEQNYLYEADYYSIRILMSIYEGVIDKQIDDEWGELANDWTPPESFIDGKEDEQEIWKMHQVKSV